MTLYFGKVLWKAMRQSLSVMSSPLPARLDPPLLLQLLKEGVSASQAGQQCKAPLRYLCSKSVHQGVERPEARGQRGQSTWRSPCTYFPVAIRWAGRRPSWRGPASASTSPALASQAAALLGSDGEDWRWASIRPICQKRER